MSKKQVILMSFVAALPAALLLYFMVMSGMEHGGNMFSGLMTVVVAITGLLCLFGLVGLPFYVMAFYPAEGFAAVVPPQEATGQQPAGIPGQADEDDDDGFEDDDDEFGGLGADDGFDDDDDFGDDGFDDDGFDDDGFDDDDDFDADDWE